MHSNQVIVLYSIIDEIPRRSVITHINRVPIEDILSIYSKHFGCSLHIQQLNAYVAAALMCVYNPFMPIHNVTINNKIISTKPMRVNSNLINKKHSFTTLVEMLKFGIEHYAHQRPSLDIQISKLTKIIYIDIHSFSDPQE